ncbi:hypothetical protein [uncultured Propionivibrio sp.]|uniref:hypothetical protein n=1 Tax=uncultured Propionivibrio sp. TaxID=426737 RepID=UPI0029C089EF|nr:hypothetical protein [uncultured Propionivibrio sp.]
MFSPQEKKLQQRALLLVAFCVGTYVVILQYFAEAPFAIPIALGLWVIAVGAMLFVVPKLIKSAFSHYWKRR